VRIDIALKNTCFGYDANRWTFATSIQDLGGGRRWHILQRAMGRRDWRRRLTNRAVQLREWVL